MAESPKKREESLLSITLDGIWEALTPEERMQAARCVCESKDRESAYLMEDLAGLMRFRPKYVMSQPVETRAKWLYERINMPDLRFYRDLLVRSWLLKHRTGMIEQFLDSQSIPRKGCFIVEGTPPPSKDSLQKGIEAIRGNFGDRDCAIYLGYLLVNSSGDDLWGALPHAIAESGFDLISALKPTTQPNSEQKSPTPSASLPEDDLSSTTLDNLVIKAIVASALGHEGAFTPDAVEHLVEEVIDLSADRPRSYFHRGFFHALFDREPQFDFRGANNERRGWYLCGFFFGLLRASKGAECVSLLKKYRHFTRLLCEEVWQCGVRLMPYLYEPLRDAGEFGLLREWLEETTDRMRIESRSHLVWKMQEDASAMLRKGQAAEANILLDAIRQALEDSELAENLADILRPLNQRKRAQALQLLGEFREAEQLLEDLLRQPESPDAPNARADMGLIRGGFRSLNAILPPANPAAADERRAALSRGREDFLEAVRRYGEDAVNAHFCLGMLGLLGEEMPPDTKVDHFQRALSGMLRKQDAYQAAGLIDWARFGLGCSMLETFDPSNAHGAFDRLNQAVAGSGTIPDWLWIKAIRLMLLFDDEERVSQFLEKLIEKRGADAFPIIRDAEAYAIESVRRRFFEWLQETPLPTLEKWKALAGMLGRDRGRQGARLDEEILDTMERLAVEHEAVRCAFIELLKAGKAEPTWKAEDVESCLIRLHELQGDFAEAARLLSLRFYRLRDRGTPEAIFEAQQTAERIRSYHLENDRSAEMLRSLQDFETLTPPNDDALSRLKLGEPVRILFVGGDETQEGYEEEIRRRMKLMYPNLEISFEFPGWTSNWNKPLERIRQKIKDYDIIVLSSMVRTHFGKHVREACGSSHPWIPCTGKGRASIEHSIERAAIWAVERRTRRRSEPHQILG